MLKKALIACAAALCLTSAAFAADISPETIIANSGIGTINIQNMIESIQCGNTEGNGIIAPTTVISGLQSNLLNVINNIVDVKVQVDENLVKDMMSGKSLPTAGITDRIGDMLSKMKAPSENLHGTETGGTGNANEKTDSGSNETFCADEKKMLDLCNEERKKRGLSPLELDDTLCRAAAYKSRDMAANGFSHDGSYGDLSDLMKLFDTDYAAVGENIAYGTQGAYSIGEIFDGWMNSSGHRANILGDFTKLGFGMYSENGITYYTQEFIR